ncbi:histidine phosphatase family protein, partial [Streptomyces tricolor]
LAAGTVNMMGHTPAYHAVASSGPGSAGSDARDRMNRRGFPAAAFALLSYDGPWKGLEPAVATLTDYWAPSD